MLIRYARGREFMHHNTTCRPESGDAANLRCGELAPGCTCLRSCPVSEKFIDSVANTNLESFR